MASFTNSSTVLTTSSTLQTFSTSVTSTTSPNEVSTSVYTSADQVVTVYITLTSELGDPTETSTTATPAINTPVSQQRSTSGLSKGGKVAVGVAVPVGVILILLALFLFFFLRRNRAKAQADRLQEVREYDFNPNTPSPPYSGGNGGGSVTNDMTELNPAPAVVASGYRGWGPSTPNAGSETWSPSLPPVAAATTATATATTALPPVEPLHVQSKSDTPASETPPPIPPMAPRRVQARNSFTPAATHSRSSSFPTLQTSQTGGSVASSAGSSTSGTASDSTPPIRNVAARRSMRVENTGPLGHSRSGISANF
ncbi:hypothetical protein V1512DRAFT_246645 [Lipomyces arxii]|uniref:uncharacterized protein n=1 Tax=Lipomyces arxii TaxID=56418 RepID=UPI0034CD9FBA